MKTVNFLTYYFIPENTAATNRVLAMVKELEKEYKVNVVCTTEKGKPCRNSRASYGKNITIDYIDQKDYNGEKFFTRALHELYYSFKIVLRSKKIPADVTIVTSPSMFLIPATAMLLYKKKKIVDIRDLVWEYMAGNSLFSKVLKFNISNLMRQSIKSFNSISVTNDNEIGWINSHVGNNRTVKITNGIERSKFDELISIKTPKREKLVVTYVGNVGIAQSIETLVDVAKELKNIQVNIVGEGSRYHFLKSYVKKNQISNIEFFGKVPREKMIDFYNKSSVLFAQLDAKFQTAMPSKLYEYASTGLPIIYAGLGEARKFVDKLENCTTIDPKNTAMLKSAIEKYIGKDIKLSQKNRIFIKENFIRETQSAKLVDMVNELLSNT